MHFGRCGETMNSETMNILVTGNNGFIGKVLTDMLISEGYRVFGLDTNYYGKDCNFYRKNSKIKCKNKDIRNVNKKDLEGIDVVCHLAALSNDPLGKINEKLTYDINYESSVRLAELSKEIGVKRFIYSSSCSMYGISDEGDLKEDGELNPITAYAKSKAFTEKSVLPLSDDDFSVTVMRNSTAYGISPKLRVDLVVNNLIGWAMTTGKIKILSDGTPWRPLIHVDDIANAFITVMKSPVEKVEGEIFNVGMNGENYQIKEIAYMIKDVFPECDIEITGEHGSDSRTYNVNFDKIERELDFIPKWNLRKGIEQIVESYGKYNLNSRNFNGRYFTRIKQLNYLMKKEMINQNLYWV